MAKAKDGAVKRTTDPVKKADKNAKKDFKGRVSQWFRDLKSELKKVVWPTREKLINNTLAALVLILASATIIWGFDSLAQMGAKSLIDLV